MQLVDQIGEENGSYRRRMVSNCIASSVENLFNLRTTHGFLPALGTCSSPSVAMMCLFPCFTVKRHNLQRPKIGVVTEAEGEYPEVREVRAVYLLSMQIEFFRYFIRLHPLQQAVVGGGLPYIGRRRRLRAEPAGLGLDGSGSHLFSQSCSVRILGQGSCSRQTKAICLQCLLFEPLYLEEEMFEDYPDKAIYLKSVMR
jgi:hypothetical protein